MLTFIKKNPEFKVNKIKKITKPKYIFIVFLKDKKNISGLKKLGSRGTDEG